MAGAVQHLALLLSLHCHPPALPGREAVGGWGLLLSVLPSKTQSAKSTQPAPLLPTGASTAGCEGTDMEPGAAVLASEVTGVTDFKNRSHSTGSQENFNENGFLTWTKLKVFAITEECLGCLWPENPPFDSAQGKTQYGNVTLDK